MLHVMCDVVVRVCSILYQHGLQFSPISGQDQIDTVYFAVCVWVMSGHGSSPVTFVSWLKLTPVSAWVTPEPWKRRSYPCTISKIVARSRLFGCGHVDSNGLARVILPALPLQRARLVRRKMALKCLQARLVCAIVRRHSTAWSLLDRLTSCPERLLISSTNECRGRSCLYLSRFDSKHCYLFVLRNFGIVRNA